MSLAVHCDSCSGAPAKRYQPQKFIDYRGPEDGVDLCYACRGEKGLMKSRTSDGKYNVIYQLTNW